MATVATRTYINAAGEESRHASPDSVALIFSFEGGGEHRVTLDMFGEDVLRAGVFHGINQKLGDAFAGQKDSDQSAEDMFLDALDALKRGEWVKPRESAGPRTSMVAEALQRVRPDKYADVAAAQAEVATWDKDTRKAKLAVPALAAEIAKVKAERAAAAAAKAAAQAGDAGDAADL